VCECYLYNTEKVVIKIIWIVRITLNQLPKELCLPTDHEDLSLSSDLSSHTRQFVTSFVTTVTIHYSFSLPFHTYNSSFPQVFSSIVLLPFDPPDWLLGLQLFSRFSLASHFQLRHCVLRYAGFQSAFKWTLNHYTSSSSSSSSVTYVDHTSIMQWS